MSVIDLDTMRPHICGPVMCGRCEHQWVAVRQAGTGWLECPKCGALRGGSLELFLNDAPHIMGDQCCGQRDSAGTCVAPACDRGTALKLIDCIAALYKAEHGSQQ